MSQLTYGTAYIICTELNIEHNKIRTTGNGIEIDGVRFTRDATTEHAFSVLKYGRVKE